MAEPLLPITSVRVETRGVHDHVSVWIGGALSGALIVDEGQGDDLKRLLLMGSEVHGSARAVAEMAVEAEPDLDVARAYEEFVAGIREGLYNAVTNIRNKTRGAPRRKAD